MLCPRQPLTVNKPCKLGWDHQLKTVNYTTGAGEMQPEYGTKEKSHPFMTQIKCNENKEDVFDSTRTCRTRMPQQ